MNNKRSTARMITSCFLSVFCMNIISCSNPTEKRSYTADNKSINATGYDFSAPDREYKLPGILHEVSGITVIDSSSVACVQDENGIIFVFDLLKNEIKEQLYFYGDGDYEGITRVNNRFYVLRSDGVLFEIGDNGSSGSKAGIIITGITADENEGLCYDQKAHRLLIAPKSNIGKGSEYKGKRPIYGFDLDSEILIEKPAYDFDLSYINKFAMDNKIILPAEKKKKSSGKKKFPENGKEINLRPSAIGIHPLTNKLFVLSSIEQMLFIFNVNGSIEYIEKLNPDIFNMPEGITFFKNGDMLISNEGQGKNATLLKFKYIRN